MGLPYWCTCRDSVGVPAVCPVGAPVAVHRLEGEKGAEPGERGAGAKTRVGYPRRTLVVCCMVCHVHYSCWIHAVYHVGVDRLEGEEGAEPGAQGAGDGVLGRGAHGGGALRLDRGKSSEECKQKVSHGWGILLG